MPYQTIQPTSKWRLYMTDLQKSQSAHSGCPRRFSERNARRFRCRPPHRLKAQDRSWAHCEPILSNAIWENDLSLFGNGQRVAARSPFCGHLQSAHPCVSPTYSYSAHPERRCAAVAGSWNGPERDIIFPARPPEPGYMGQSDFTIADELGVMIAGQAVPHLAFFPNFRSGSTAAGNTCVVLWGMGKSFTGAAENLAGKPYVGAWWRAAQKPTGPTAFRRFPHLTTDQREDITSAMMPSVGPLRMTPAQQPGEGTENGAVESRTGIFKKAMLIRHCPCAAAADSQRFEVTGTSSTRWYGPAQQSSEGLLLVQAERTHLTPLGRSGAPPLFTEIVPQSRRRAGS